VSESNRVQVSYGKEVTWDTIPAIAFEEVRRTGGTFNLVTSTTESQEVRSDRMVADIIRTGLESSGTVDTELSYGAHDDLTEAGLATAWTTAYNTLDGTLTTTTAGNVNLTGAFTNLAVGDWFEIRDSSGGSNDGFYKIKTRTDADNAIVEDWQSLVAETSTATVDIVHGGQLKGPGTTASSFTFQEGYLDHPTNPTWIAFRGSRVGSMDLTVAVDSVINGSFGLMGATVESQGPVAIPGYATTSINAAPTDSVMNVIDNITQVQFGSTALSLDVSQITFSAQNNLRVQRAIGSNYPIGIAYGTFGLTGNFTAYFDDPTLLTYYENFTSTRLSFVAQATDGAAYVFEVPSLKITGDLPDPGGLDTDVMVPFNFSAFKDATEGIVFRVTRFEATPT
jgi:hypothetical protein